QSHRCAGSTRTHWKGAHQQFTRDRRESGVGHQRCRQDQRVSNDPHGGQASGCATTGSTDQARGRSERATAAGRCAGTPSYARGRAADSGIGPNDPGAGSAAARSSAHAAIRPPTAGAPAADRTPSTTAAGITVTAAAITVTAAGITVTAAGITSAGAASALNLYNCP